MERIDYDFQPIASRRAPRFQVTGRYMDGTSRVLGQIEYRWIRHLRQHGWEATGHDGHRAVHDYRSQAAQALSWDGTGYPFPFKRLPQYD